MMTWVYVGGTFDMFHHGHAEFLRKCRDYGRVIVSLNSDEFAERYKRKPIMNISERMAAAQACRWVDKVVVNIGDEDTGKTIDSLTGVKVIYIAHGDDWTGNSLLGQLGISQEWLDERSIQMLYVPYTRGISSSDIIRRISGNVHSNCNCSCGRGSNATYDQLPSGPDQGP
jgi:glycerol-3-phosphate cytidylyltransferase